MIFRQICIDKTQPLKYKRGLPIDECQGGRRVADAWLSFRFDTYARAPKYSLAARRIDAAFDEAILLVAIIALKLWAESSLLSWTIWSEGLIHHRKGLIHHRRRSTLGRKTSLQFLPSPPQPRVSDAVAARRTASTAAAGYISAAACHCIFPRPLALQPTPAAADTFAPPPNVVSNAALLYLSAAASVRILLPRQKFQLPRQLHHIARKLELLGTCIDVPRARPEVASGFIICFAINPPL
eukprot:6181217-Pleurochrysis_carterae.AAC.3